MTAELEFAIQCARDAGEIVLKHFRRHCSVAHKSRGNPVTTADLEADACLREAVSRQFPDDGWLSEETADTPRRLGCSRVWVVDPLDGTKEFVEGIPEFALSIALVAGGEAVVAAVFNPASGDLVTAIRGGGTRRNGAPVRVSSVDRLSAAHLLLSRTERSAGLFRARKPVSRLRSIGSVAWKLSLVASGQGDGTVSLRPKNEWDVCAGTLLVQEAGGVVTDLDGKQLVFNRRDCIVNGVVAANSRLHGQLLRWSGRLPRDTAPKP